MGESVLQTERGEFNPLSENQKLMKHLKPTFDKSDRFIVKAFYDGLSNYFIFMFFSYHNKKHLDSLKKNISSKLRFLL